MSFSLTTSQVVARTKTVTRRIGWTFLKPGELVQAIEKGMGLKKGEKVRRLGVLRVVKVSRERLGDITRADLNAEGFPTWRIDEFVHMFCATHRISLGDLQQRDNKPCCPPVRGSRPLTPDDLVTRIEFEYVDEARS